ncbi:hypothetical protein PR202_gb14906 [Eleusine coracana subsp. coracana]|uniref:Agmatine deiminase n=1 Tax=Eleusine coracana subsp. coracana TaxID=191504 RepID=A0AAV5EU61_ELECO|nr:hypothetical protein PR202_gb14906 [Eleusine coracana subsp. coracana]
MGFRMPAEWEPHEQCWMGWPEHPNNWRENAAPAQETFARVAIAISKFEPVTVCATAEQYPHVQELMQHQKNFRVVEMSMNGPWFRDMRSTFITYKAGPESGITEQTITGIDWEFNAWGGIYEDCRLDNAVAKKVSKNKAAVNSKQLFILNVHHNRRVPAEPQPKPQHEQAGDRELAQGLPWSHQGDEDTNGHVDNMCCFIQPGVVLLSWTDDETDPQYERSAKALETLSRSVDAKGRQIQVVKIHIPGPLYRTEEEADDVVSTVNFSEARGCCSAPPPPPPPPQHGVQFHPWLAASYVNFFVANGGVVAPAFGDERDGEARAVLQKEFPDCEVVIVEGGREIVLGGGNIHYITQQQPVRPSSSSP